MSNHNVFEQNGVQRPMFAPVSQKSKFDEIDLSDIFAEYLNDADDPLTTFSNFSNLTKGIQQQQQPAQVNYGQPTTVNNQGYNAQTSGNTMMDITLPTGRGIQTAFHSGVNRPMVQSMPQQQVQQQEPLAKRPKVENHNASQIHHPGRAVVPSNLSTSGAGITSRLGLSVSGGQIRLPQPKPTPQSNIQLPIGVGIRVGGVPAQPSGGMQLNHMQWNSSGSANNMGGQWSGQNIPTGGTSLVPDHAMAERRQRNREHAKRSRVRKKFLLESLQAEVRQLQEENQNLRMFVQQRIPQHAQQIIDTCCLKSSLFGDNESNNDTTELTKSDFSLIENLTSGQQNFVLSDPRLPDNPIVFASPGFYELTGYTREQVLGRNCRFLQGPGTDPKAVDVIRTAVANGTDASTCILNYKADGTPFWNQFFVAALRDSDNCIVNYVGVQCVVDPEAGTSVLEDKVDSVLPLQNKGQSLQDN